MASTGTKEDYPWHDAWRQRLGEVPHVELFKQLDSLNEVPVSVVEAARRLSPDRSAIAFISAYLRDKQEAWVREFVQDVVRSGESPEHWQRKRLLVAAPSFQDHVILPRQRLLACLGGAPELRVQPELSSWQDGTSWAGAPLHAEWHADYRNPIAEGAVNLVVAKTQPIGDVDVAVRRWIAARIARVTFNKLGMDFTNVAQVAAEYAPPTSWTHDAQVALQALVRESQLFYADRADPPGFRGPDEWFRG